MLDFIKSEQQELYACKIESFLDLIRVYQKKEITDQERKKCTFFIAADEGKGIYGGAVLYKVKVHSLPEKLKNLLNVLEPDLCEIWSSIFCFNFFQEGPCVQDNRGELSQQFYTDLLSNYRDFCHDAGSSFLHIKATPCEYRCSKQSGFGSCLLEIHPNALEEGSCHGLLMVDGLLYCRYLKVSKGLNRHFLCSSLESSPPRKGESKFSHPFKRDLLLLIFFLRCFICTDASEKVFSVDRNFKKP